MQTGSILDIWDVGKFWGIFYGEKEDFANLYLFCLFTFNNFYWKHFFQKLTVLDCNSGIHRKSIVGPDNILVSLTKKYTTDEIVS